MDCENIKRNKFIKNRKISKKEDEIKNYNRYSTSRILDNNGYKKIYVDGDDDYENYDWPKNSMTNIGDNNEKKRKIKNDNDKIEEKNERKNKNEEKKKEERNDVKEKFD